MSQETANDRSLQVVQKQDHSPDPEIGSYLQNSHTHNILKLQHTVGNRAVQRLLAAQKPPAPIIQRTIVRLHAGTVINIGTENNPHRLISVLREVDDVELVNHDGSDPNLDEEILERLEEIGVLEDSNMLGTFHDLMESLPRDEFIDTVLLPATNRAEKLQLSWESPERGSHFDLLGNGVHVAVGEAKNSEMLFELVNASHHAHFARIHQRRQNATLQGEDPHRTAAIYAIDAECVEFATAIRTHLLSAGWQGEQSFLLEFLEPKSLSWWLNYQIQQGHTKAYDPSVDQGFDNWPGKQILAQNYWGNANAAVPLSDLGIQFLLNAAGNAPVVLPQPPQHQPPQQPQGNLSDFFQFI